MPSEAVSSFCPYGNYLIPPCTAYSCVAWSYFKRYVLLQSNYLNISLSVLWKLHLHLSKKLQTYIFVINAMLFHKSVRLNITLWYRDYKLYYAKDMEARDEGVIGGTVWVFAWTECDKPQETCHVNTISGRGSNQEFSNTSQKCYYCSQLVRWLNVHYATHSGNKLVFTEEYKQMTIWGYFEH